MTHIHTVFVKANEGGEAAVAAVQQALAAGGLNAEVRMLHDVGKSPTVSVGGTAYSRDFVESAVNFIRTRHVGYVDIVFDGPPGPEAGRFVEAESPAGRSVRAGEWIEPGVGDEYWRLRMPVVLDPEATELLADEDGAPYPPDVQHARMFFLWRSTDVTKVTVPEGGEPRCVAVGIQYPDGQCALWWVPPETSEDEKRRRGMWLDHGVGLRPHTSVAMWPSIEDLKAVHLHPQSQTELVWVTR